jgi:hypothetical protein
MKTGATIFLPDGILRSFNLNPHRRTNASWILWLDEHKRRRVHELAKRYGTDYSDDPLMQVAVMRCEICQEAENARVGLTEESGSREQTRGRRVEAKNRPNKKVKK